MDPIFDVWLEVMRLTAYQRSKQTWGAYERPAPPGEFSKAEPNIRRAQEPIRWLLSLARILQR